MTQFQGHALYLLFLAAFALAVPPVVWNPDAPQFLFVLGALALWRYGWAALNWLRHLWYTRRVFPCWRKEADALGEDALPSHVYLLVTSFRIPTETTRRVYGGAIAEAVRYATVHGRRATVVASIVERADEVLIRKLFELYQPPETVKLIFVRIAGTGKRDALAFGFRAISKSNPPPDALVAVIDGDSIVPEGLIARCAPFFALFPNMAALTTDEDCEVEGSALFKTWYALRFAQRHVFMASVSLSRKVLTLTGRMSMFRASVVCDAAFIRRVEMDYIDHWRLGRFRFLTGDDKSTWFHLLEGGHEMLYLPDVAVTTIETPPDRSFSKSSVMLMRRWFGNMLRTNGRALNLGVRRVGLFPWVAVLDQRVSMWTSLASPVIAFLGTLFVAPVVMVYYLLWIALTRYGMTLALFAARREASAIWPFLLYYNQIVGAVVKISVLFRPDRQQWTRQKTSIAGEGRFAAMCGSHLMRACSVAFFFAAAGLASGILSVPDIHYWYHRLT